MEQSKIEKPWGHEKIWAKTDNYVGKIIFIKPGERLSKQFHRKKIETVYVLEGTLINYDKNDIVEKYVAGDSLHIPAGQIHRFGATKRTGVTIVEVSTNDLEDIVRLEDDYGRR